MNRKLLITALCVLLVVLFVQSTGLFAQEVTPEAPPVVVVTDPPVVVDAVTTSQLFTTALIVIGAIVGVAFGVFGYIVRPALVAALNQIPQWGAEMFFSAGDAGLTAVERYAETTETVIDDNEVAKLRRDFDQLREEVRAARDTG